MSVATVKKPPKAERPKWETEKFWIKAYGKWWPPIRDDRKRPVREAPRWKVERWAYMVCMGWWPGEVPPGTSGEWIETPAQSITNDSEDEIEIPAKRVHTGAVMHFQNLANCFFSDPQGVWYFEWGPWAVQMLTDKVTCRRLSIAGSASCVHGDTRILNPITGEQPTIRELCEASIRPTVMTVSGPVLAGVPFIKGEEELLEIELSNGGKFKCTPAHRVLTPSGYVSASSLSVGVELFGYSQVPQESTSELGPSVHASSAQSFQKKAEDYQGYCSACFRLCGEQLLQARESSRSDAPLRACAQIYNENACGRSGGLCSESERSHPYQSGGPSTHNVDHLLSWLESLSSPHSCEETFSQWNPSCQTFDLFPKDSRHPYTSEASLPHASRRRFLGMSGSSHQEDTHFDAECHSLFGGLYQVAQRQACNFPAPDKEPPPTDSFHASRSTCQLMVQVVSVTAIRKSGKHTFYDLHVPVEHHYFAEGGIHHNSGKTEFLVLWGLLNWICDPFKTKVLVGSTNKTAALGKVWGSFDEAYQQMERVLKGMGDVMPGKMLKSQYKVIYEVNGVRSTKAGIELIAGAESEAAESADKIQGVKRERVFVCADEFSTMAKGTYNTIKGNLFANPMLDFTATFNPSSYFNSAGLFSTPKAGWDSVSVDTEFYESIEGWVRHLDGEKSPNINSVTGTAKWRGILTYDKLMERAADAGGRNTAKYFTFVRGWFPPMGAIDTIYTESEIMKCMAHMKVDPERWDGPVVKVCGFDPAFTHGGDLAIATFGSCGYVKEPLTHRRKKVLQIDDVVVLAEDARTKEPKVDQMVRQLISECKKRGVDPRHMAMDETGGGIALASLIARDWENSFLRVQFGGSPTDMPISIDNPNKASDEFHNRVTELWMVGKPIMRAGQLYIGSRPDVITEMTSRLFRDKGKKRCVESKEDMKDRLKGAGGSKSPDRADSLFLTLDLCRQRLGLSSAERPGKVNRPTTPFTSIQQYLQPGKRPQNLWNYGPSLKESGPKWS